MQTEVIAVILGVFALLSIVGIVLFGSRGAIPWIVLWTLTFITAMGVAMFERRE